MTFFPEDAPSANPVFFRTYSRSIGGQRESFDDVNDRTVSGVAELGELTESETELISQMQLQQKTFTSGRWLWVGGTDWVKQPENFSGAYNCTSSDVDDWRSFGLLMNLAMCGTGTGAVLEPRCIEQLPIIRNQLNVTIVEEIGKVPPDERDSETHLYVWDVDKATIVVGDSRQGWVDSYQHLIELSSAERFNGQPVSVSVFLGNVRPARERLKGFGGVSNPVKLTELYGKCAAILNGAIGRQLNSLECCLLIDEAALVVVAGNLRRSAGIRQFASEDPLGETAKDNLWQQGEDGSWRIDPDRDALRMANHTRVYHTIPSLETIVASVTKQFYSGEGAIQYAPEAIVRASADLLRNRGDKKAFIRSYLKSPEEAKNLFLMMGVPEEEADDRLHRYGLNPCLAKGTIVKTGYGHYPIEELMGKTVFVWDNEKWVSVDNFRVTGTNQPIVKVIFSNGTFVRATPNHKFFLKNGESIEVKDLLPEMELLTDSTYPNQKIFVSQTIEDGIDDEVYCCTVPDTHRFALANGIVSGNCGEIIMRNNHCNLAEVHLNRLNPNDRDEQEDAFKAAAIWVSALLHHEFVEPRYQRSRELDPIVGVSFTGLFDFFVKAFGVDWLRWWQAGRSDDWNEASEEGKDLIADIANSFPDWHGYPLKTKSGTMYKDLERCYLEWWRLIVEETVTEYCDRHGLRTPNRCTTCQPAGTKSLLTGASPGWHPPKAAWFIRRITFGKNDPVALACIDYGYTVIPSQSDKDEDGRLLDDPFDPRCTEWLVEIPTAVSWADIPGVEEVDISQFSALAQFDFYMQVQEHYVGHNASATIELRATEIEPLAKAIHTAIVADKGYISATLLARFDDLQTFPRLPFEPITKTEYNVLHEAVLKRRINPDFQAALAKYDRGENIAPAGCDSDKCLFPSK